MFDLIEEVYFRVINRARQNLGPGLRDGCKQKLLPDGKDGSYFEYNRGGNKIDIPININTRIRKDSHPWENEMHIKKNVEAIKKDAEAIVLNLEYKKDQVVIDAMAKMFVIAPDGSSLKQTSAHPTGHKSYMIVTGVGNTKEYCLSRNHIQEGLSQLDRSDHDIKNAQLLVTQNIETQIRLDSVFEGHTCATNLPSRFIGKYDGIKAFTIPDSFHPDFGLPYTQLVPGVKQRALCFLYISETIGYASSGESFDPWETGIYGRWGNFGSGHIRISADVGSVVIDPTGIVGILCNNNIDMGKREDPMQ